MGHEQQQKMLNTTEQNSIYFAGKPNSIPWLSNQAAVKQAYDPATWNYKENYLGSKFGVNSPKRGPPTIPQKTPQTLT